MDSVPPLCSGPANLHFLTEPLSNHVLTWQYLLDGTRTSDLIWLKKKLWIPTRLSQMNSKHTQRPLPPGEKAVCCSWLFTSKSRILSYQRPKPGNPTFLLFLKCIIFCPLLLPSHWSIFIIPLQPPPWPCLASKFHAVPRPSWNPRCKPPSL